MSYAKTFDEIFTRLFGSRGAKPRIRKHWLGWKCSTPDGSAGYGVTPRAAYIAWRHRR